MYSTLFDVAMLGLLPLAAKLINRSSFSTPRGIIASAIERMWNVWWMDRSDSGRFCRAGRMSERAPRKTAERTWSVGIM